ncbi:hypothetical protein [Mucilaginibacter sp. UR6-11]|uniref:hypothetical protein n=1 Tax=Mucilaginibacter sp. UR6-11 TaxID=1435644 RepID=UPI00351D5C44
MEVAAKLAKALDISLDYLSELTDIELDSNVLARINEITTLSDDDKKQIYRVVDALIKDYAAKNEM